MVIWPIGYKIKIQKLLAFHYFSTGLRKGEENSILSSNRYHNYFRRMLTRKVSLLHEENESFIEGHKIRSNQIKGHYT